MTGKYEISPEWVQEVDGWIDEMLFSPPPPSSSPSCQKNVQRIAVEEQEVSPVGSGRVSPERFQPFSVQRPKAGAVNTH